MSTFPRTFKKTILYMTNLTFINNYEFLFVKQHLLLESSALFVLYGYCFINFRLFNTPTAHNVSANGESRKYARTCSKWRPFCARKRPAAILDAEQSVE